MTTDLKSQLALLMSLQDIDVVLHQIERQLVEIPVKTEDALTPFKETTDAVAKKEADKAALEKQRKNEEKAVEEEYQRIKERETKLYAIKTNKEYQAAIKEIADAKQANRDREEAILGLMEKIDTINKEITQLSAGLADKQTVFKEKETELKKEETALVAERERLLTQHREAEKGVDAGVLKQYRFIQKRFSDGMALAVNGICSGCNKRIPPQVYIELQKWKEIIICPNCHRLLFFQEAPEAAQAV